MRAESDLVIQRELDLLTVGVRSDPVALDRLLHPGFTEIGASGTQWTREAIIEALLASPHTSGVATDMSARIIGDGVILVTYRTTGPERDTLRSSWWVRTGPDWQVIFHQGTPTATTVTSRPA